MFTLSQLARQTVTAWMEDDAGLLGAGLAYYGLLSLAPLLMIVVWVAGLYLGEETAIVQVSALVAELFGAETEDAAISMLLAIRAAEGGLSTSVLGLAVTVFASTRLFAQLQTALHQCWGITAAEGDVMLRLGHNLLRRLFSFLVLLLMGVILMVAATLQSILGFSSGWIATIPLAVEGVANLILGVMLAFGLTLVFRWLPCARVRLKDVIPGAMLTTGLLLVGKFAIAAYLARFAVASAYGIAGTTLVLVLWMAYSAQIFLFGAEFTKVWLDQTEDGMKPLRGWVRVKRVAMDRPTND